MDKFLIAAVFGPVMIIFGLARLFCAPQQREIEESVKKTPALVWMGALLGLFFGLLIVNVYNIWAWNMAVLVTILGWFFIIRAIFMILFPQKMIQLIDNRALNIIGSTVAVIWGIALTIFAHY